MKAREIIAWLLSVLLLCAVIFQQLRIHSMRDWIDPVEIEETYGRDVSDYREAWKSVQASLKEAESQRDAYWRQLGECRQENLALKLRLP